MIVSRFAQSDSETRWLSVGLWLDGFHGGCDGREREAKAGRLQKRREMEQNKRERTGDTPEAEAERRKQDKDYDADGMKKRVGNPGAAFLS